MTITKDIRYIGVNDHAVDLFEGRSCSRRTARSGIF